MYGGTFSFSDSVNFGDPRSSKSLLNTESSRVISTNLSSTNLISTIYFIRTLIPFFGHIQILWLATQHHLSSLLVEMAWGSLKRSAFLEIEIARQPQRPDYSQTIAIIY